jgi:hypothetical protein
MAVKSRVRWIGHVESMADEKCIQTLAGQYEERPHGRPEHRMIILKLILKGKDVRMSTRHTRPRADTKGVILCEQIMDLRVP